jgi:hypothetical protein
VDRALDFKAGLRHGAERAGQKKKRALTDRPSELNHFDDTLAGSEPPTPANDQ